MLMALILAFGIVTAADAHNHNVSGDCTQVTVTLTNYATHTGKTNHVTVMVDGVPRVDQDFGSGYSNTFYFDNRWVDNNYDVKVHAWDNQAYSFDTGLVSVAACVPVNDASASLSTTPPTCHTPETLVLGPAVNATWGIPSRMQGPGDYTVPATANLGHAFADGTTAETFAGTLAGDLSKTKACAPPKPKTHHTWVHFRKWQSCKWTERFIQVRHGRGIAKVTHKYNGDRTHIVVKVVAKPGFKFHHGRHGLGHYVHRERLVFHLKPMGPCMPGPPGSGKI